MDITKIPTGRNVPQDVHAVIEIPVDQSPVKYEFDYGSGTMQVDRFLNTPMRYPGNYGFIPHTLSDDGDAVDVLVMTDVHIESKAYLSVKPIGVLVMEDESGMDEKIIAVPTPDLNPFYADITQIDELPTNTKNKIQHFFEHYKDLEPGKWSKLVRWGSKEDAEKIIMDGVERYTAKYGDKPTRP